VNLVTDIKYPGGVMNYFYYDAMLRRYAMGASSGLRYFTWDQNGMNLLCERDSAGSVTAYYTHGYTPVDGIGSAVAVKQNRYGAAYYQYPGYDNKGTQTAITDENGNQVAKYNFNAWGELLSSEVTGGISETRLGYQSNWIRLKDSDRDLYLSPTRVYDAKLGRFLGRDLITRATLSGAAEVLIPNREIRESLAQDDSRRNTDAPLVISRGASYRYAPTQPINVVDATGLWTLGVGVGFGWTLGMAWFGFEAILVFDSCGNQGVLACSEQGFGGGLSVGAGVVLQWTEACTICDLEGPAVQVGASLSLVELPVGAGLDVVVANNYVGVEFQGGWGVGTPEVHFGLSVCKLFWPNNDPCLGKKMKNPPTKPAPGIIQAFKNGIDKELKTFRQKHNLKEIDVTKSRERTESIVPWGRNSKPSIRTRQIPADQPAIGVPLPWDVIAPGIPRPPWHGGGNIG
jgi:hypothetical protein